MRKLLGTTLKIRGSCPLENFYSPEYGNGIRYPDESCDLMITVKAPKDRYYSIRIVDKMTETRE